MIQEVKRSNVLQIEVESHTNLHFHAADFICSTRAISEEGNVHSPSCFHLVQFACNQEAGTVNLVEVNAS